MENIIKYKGPVSNKYPQCVFEFEGERCQSNTYNGGRGLCPIHYCGHRYHVLKGNTTWKKLEEEGKCNRKLTQAEKNINQMKPHRTYNKKNPSST